MKGFRILVPLLLVLALTIGMAAPAIAHTGASTVLTMEVSATEVCAGETVVLTIVETNDSAEWSQWRDLSPAWVELQPLGITLDDTSAAYNFSSNKGNSDGVLEWHEVWTWTVSVQVDADTTFTAIGHGVTLDGYDMTPPLDPDEMAEVTVTVVPCNGGGEGHTPGYWKNHLDEWQGYTPDDDFDTVFGVDVYNPDITLDDGIRAKGGGLSALTRHAVAALLSAAHANVDYPMTEAEVIAAVQDALGDQNNWTIKSLKNQLDEYNNLGADMSS